MIEITTVTLTEGAYSAFEILAIGLVISFSIWYAQFHWRRRHLYELASKINGPLALPFIGCAYHFLGSPEQFMEKLMTFMKIYRGSVRFWFGTKLIIVVRDPKDIEITFNNSKTLEKSDVFDVTEKGLGQGLIVSKVAIWKKNRKLINPSFNNKNLESFVEVFVKKSSDLIESLNKYCGKGEFDTYKEITNFTLETIFETAMGINLNIQTSHSQFKECFEHLSEIYFRKITIFFYQFDFIYKLTKYHKLEDQCIKYFDKFFTEIIVKKTIQYKNKVKEKNDNYNKVPRQEPFLERLFQLRYDGHNISEKQIRDEVCNFIAAGFDTTATAIGFTLLTLAMFPDIQQRAFEEVMEVLGPDRDVHSSDLTNLKYIERVIKETLRFFPLSIGTLRKVFEDIKLDSYILPANSEVFLSIQGVHMNEKYWPDPYKFDPNRFLPEIAEKRHPFAYVPFGAGPRNCIGRKYAMMSIKTVLASILRKYILSTTYTKIEDVRIKAHIVIRPCDGYKVSINVRK